MKKVLKAFTLAEVMIVLSVIGILAGILIPVANNSRPDEKVMKFKKAHATLANVVREMVNSDKYYANGDLGKRADGTLIDKHYFCNTFADIVSAKSVNCDYEIPVGGYIQLCGKNNGTCSTSSYEINTIKHELDSNCRNAANGAIGDIGIRTADNIYYFERSLNMNFGCVIGSTCEYTRWENGYGNGTRFYGSDLDISNFENGITTYRYYKIFCIDIDELGKGEKPFGYGIRADGKIITGKRADEWLEKDFQKGKNDN